MENSPDSLFFICLEYCTKSANQVFKVQDGAYTLSSGYSLPRVVCDPLLKTAVEMNHQEIHKFIKFFGTKKTDLKHIDLRAVEDLREEDLLPLIRHQPIELCFSLQNGSKETLRYINKYGSNLQTLLLGESFKLFELEDEDILNLDTMEMAATKQESVEQCIIDIPTLRVFGLNALCDLIDATTFLLPSLLKMPRLVRLDLSGCALWLGDIEMALTKFQYLRELYLSNVDLEPFKESVKILSQIKTLRALDLSQSLPDAQRKSYSGNVNDEMRRLVSSLPQLMWLDIAGTNLAGAPPWTSMSHHHHHKMGMTLEVPVEPPAISWLDDARTLDYLGLHNCVDNPWERQNIPARQVTGEANEKQTLLAVRMYTNKRELLLMALNNLFHIFKYDECTNQLDALQGIMMAMKKYPNNKAVQISGSASLFYIVKGELRHQLSSKIKMELLSIILNGVENHLDEPTMLRNGCLTLCHFQLPQDVMHCYGRLVSLLHKIAVMKLPESETFVQRISIYLLNSLACQIDTKEKLLIGELGAFKTMLSIIKARTEQGNCDEIMEVAWSLMWNVTDETALNSERFINEGGMEIFLKCLQRFPDKEELLRNMMGLMGNIAEVEYLRPKLMQQTYITIFSDLLSSTSDGIEVSYNACGVLANIMSDGQDVWTVNSPTRVSVLQNMRAAITRWKLNTKRNINYRSFKPILRLLDMTDTPEVQHWAVWALCNLTKKYKSKYCPLLEKEGGLSQLATLMTDDRAYADIKLLSAQVLERCQRFRDDPTLISDDEEAENMAVDEQE